MRRQRDVLGWLRFPEREGAARIVAKVIPEAVTEASMLALRAALADEHAARLLAHLPHVNAGVLGLVGDATLRPAVTPRLLAEVAASARAIGAVRRWLENEPLAM